MWSAGTLCPGSVRLQSMPLLPSGWHGLASAGCTWVCTHPLTSWEGPSSRSWFYPATSQLMVSLQSFVHDEAHAALVKNYGLPPSLRILLALHAWHDDYLGIDNRRGRWLCNCLYQSAPQTGHLCLRAEQFGIAVQLMRSAGLCCCRSVRVLDDA